MHCTCSPSHSSSLKTLIFTLRVPLHAHAAANCQGQSQLSLVLPPSLSVSPSRHQSTCFSFHVKSTCASYADIFLPHFTVISLELVVTCDGPRKNVASCPHVEIETRWSREQFTRCAVYSVHLTLHQGVLSYKCVIDTM